MNSTLTASLQLALLKVGTPDRRKTEFSDNVLAVFRAASGDSETTNTIVSGIFKGLLSFDSLDSEEVITSFLKGVEGSIGFNPFEEPGKLHAILSNLDAPSNDVDISESSPGFWSSFILEALATIVFLGEAKSHHGNQRRRLIGHNDGALRPHRRDGEVS